MSPAFRTLFSEGPLLFKDGVRWFCIRAAMVKPNETTKEDFGLDNKNVFERFATEITSGKTDFAFAIINRSRLINNHPCSQAFVAVFDWGFSKHKLMQKVGADFTKMVSLAKLVGLEVGSQNGADDYCWKAFWLLLRSAADTPKIDSSRPMGGFRLGTTPEGKTVVVEQSDLFKHVVVLGETGSGKTSFVGKLVRSWALQSQHYLILDWHGEYPEILKDNSCLIVAPDQDLGFDIFDYPSNVDPLAHIDTLMDVFSDSFDLSVSQQFMLRSALRKLYTKKGHGIKPSPEHIVMRELVAEISDMRTYSNWEQESKLAVLRRISKLTDTGLSKMLNAEQKIGFGDLLNENVAVDLGQITDNYAKILVVEAILKLLYDYKVSRRLTDAHMTVTEEARNIVPFRRPEEPPKIMERITEELRKFGESIVIVNQLPSTLSPEVLTAAGTIVCFRLKGAAEYDILTRRCNIKPDECMALANTATGNALCRLSDNSVLFLTK